MLTFNYGRNSKQIQYLCLIVLLLPPREIFSKYEISKCFPFKFQLRFNLFKGTTVFHILYFLGVILIRFTGHGFILVYSISSRQSLEELKPILELIGEVTHHNSAVIKLLEGSFQTKKREKHTPFLNHLFPLKSAQQKITNHFDFCWGWQKYHMFYICILFFSTFP